MPIYEYGCPARGAQFEFIKFGQNDKPLACPKCDNKTGLTKLMSKPAAEKTKWPIKKRRLPDTLKKFNK